jgi:hypothetical protein
MAEIVNLRMVRKRAARLRHEQQSAENRLKSGRSKAQHALQDAERALNKRRIDRHRIEQGDVHEIAGNEEIDRDRRP